MIKSELVECVMRIYPRLDQRDAQKAVDAVFDSIGDALAKGNRVEIRGFGVFAVKERPSRTGRNPRTGQRVRVGAKRLPVFKAGKEMHEALNKRVAPSSPHHNVCSGSVEQAVPVALTAAGDD